MTYLDWFRKQYCCIDWNIVKKEINNRKVYIWGAYRGGYYLKLFLNEIGIEITGFIDGKADKMFFGEICCLPAADLPTREECFVIVAVQGRRQAITDALNGSMFIEKRDYIYVTDFVPEYTLCHVTGSFEDIYGNRITSDGHSESIINICGWNNKIDIGKNSGDKNLSIQVNGESHFCVGSDLITNNGVNQIICLFGGQIRVGNKVYLSKDINVLSKGGSIVIGDNTEVGERCFFLCGMSDKLVVGSGCLFSHDVSLFASNGHSVLDVENKKNYNDGGNFINLSDHVWVGKGATILHDSNIAKNCVIGANALVKGCFSGGQIIAGNPASVIRKNVTWDRQENIEWDILS